jgi:hypothetical protein
MMRRYGSGREVIEGVREGAKKRVGMNLQISSSRISTSADAVRAQHNDPEISDSAVHNQLIHHSFTCSHE